MRQWLSPPKCWIHLHMATNHLHSCFKHVYMDISSIHNDPLKISFTGTLKLLLCILGPQYWCILGPQYWCFVMYEPLFRLVKAKTIYKKYRFAKVAMEGPTKIKNIVHNKPLQGCQSLDKWGGATYYTFLHLGLLVLIFPTNMIINLPMYSHFQHAKVWSFQVALWRVSWYMAASWEILWLCTSLFM